MTNKPLTISVITPSYNQAQFLEETIQSVLSQDYPQLEYIIVDGGSTDGSVEIIKKYEKQISQWVSEPDTGQSDAINKGWKMASGDIITWLNTDDTYCPGTISTAADIFHKNPETILVHGAANTYDQSGHRLLFTSQPFAMDPYEMIMSCGGVTTQPSIFFRRIVLNEIGYLDTNLHYIMDWEYWIRMGLHFGSHRFQKIDTILSNNRDWSGTKTNQGWKEICLENRIVLDKIFFSHQNDQRLAHIKPASYRSSYRKEAELARLNDEPLKALQNIFSAWRIEPFKHIPARELVLLLYVLLGKKWSSRLRTITQPLRNILNRHVGF